MSASTEAKFVFVQADDLGKPKATDRSVIRSHCMRGRNKRADSRRSLREARQRQTAQASSGASELIHAKSRWWSDDLEKPSLDDVESLTAIAWLPSLHAPVSDIGLIKFVEAPNGYTRELLHKCKSPLCPMTIVNSLALTDTTVSFHIRQYKGHDVSCRSVHRVREGRKERVSPVALLR